ncbi:hypothetical protein THAOC_30332, partial [Thalassiosira oceanica]
SVARASASCPRFRSARNSGKGGKAYGDGMLDRPFCRTLLQKTDSEALAMIRKWVDAGNPMAIYNLGNLYEYGRHGLEKNSSSIEKMPDKISAALVVGAEADGDFPTPSDPEQLSDLARKPSSSRAQRN